MSERVQTSPLISSSIVYLNSRVNFGYATPATGFINDLCDTGTLFRSIGGLNVDSIELGICRLYRKRGFEEKYPNGERSPVLRIEG